MAVIEKIRQRTGLLIIFVGLALLLFLVSDAISNNMNLFRGSDNTVGVIDGKNITYQEFNDKLETYKSNMEQQGQKVDEFTSNMIREQIWNEYIQNIVVNEQYEELGLMVTGDEIFATVTNPVDIPQIRDAEAFKNKSTNQFDPALVINYLKQIDQDPSGQAKRSWVEFEEKSLKPQLISKKYNTLITKGVYRTSLEVKADFNDNNVQVDGKVVGFNFNSIVDDSVSVSEDEMRKYLNEHPEDYQQEASRRIEYVVFDIYPSAEDTAKVFNWAKEKAVKFKSATNDTLFIASNNPTTGFDTTFKPRGSYIDRVDEAIFSANENDVIGPIYDGGEFSIYKVLHFKEDSVPYIRASQILIKPRGGYEKEDSLYALVRGNTILKALRNGADFEQMARDSSQDYRTAAKGGDLGWMKKAGGTLPEVVERNLFATSEGGMFVVRSSMGVHVIKVTGGKTTRLAHVGRISRKVEYSNETENGVYDQAYQFAATSRDGDAFTENTDKMGLIKRISPDMPEGESKLPNIEDAREVIRWAFDEETEIGDVSKVIPSGDKYIVAQLVNIKEKGTAKLEDVRDQLEADTRRAKKAEILKQRIKNAMGGDKNIEQIALDLGAIVSTVPNVSMSNPNLPFVGNDPKLAGAMIGSQQDKLYGPLETKNGVYLYVVTARREAGEPQNILAERTRMIQEASGQVGGRAFEALKEAANIKDYRYKFF